MKKLLPLIFTILTLISAPSAHADDTWYLGALYSVQEVSIQSRDLNTVGIILGYQFNKYFSLETRLSTGISSYSITYEPINAEIEENINTQAALLIKASYPIFKSFNVYGLVGHSNTKSEIKISASDHPYSGFPSSNLTETGSGFTYGLGLNYQITEQFNMFVDYQVLPEFDYFSRSFKSASIGMNYSF